MMRKQLLTAVSVVAVLTGALTTELPAALTEVRSIDGSGNNIANPAFGQANEHLLRLTNNTYADGISTPRGGDPSSLPNPRLISNAVSAQSGNQFNNRQMSDWVWQWGQFIDHDIDLTNNADPAEAFNIPVPTGDVFFDPFNTGTQEINLNRSLFDPTTGTDASNPREQINQITAFIDGSNVYGSDTVTADALRTFSGGKLDSEIIAGEELLPKDAGFFFAGDVRANEQVALTATHTLFMREHNRLAELLATNDPNLTDEEIYQKARKIVGAELQIITYNEFLPALLGDSVASTLDPNNASYDDTIDAGIANEFSTASYRFGHSMLAPDLQLIDDLGNSVGVIALRDAFFDPSILTGDPGKLDLLIKGMATQAAQEIDTKIVDDVRNFLFGPPGSGGFDLGSLNIQRGRDHGIGTYNDYRIALGLAAKPDFFDPGDGSGITTDANLATALANLFGTIDDVDIWVGGLAEDHLEGSSVGELIAAALTDQFLRLRDGDRFFFKFDSDLDHTDITSIIDLDNLQLSDVIRNNTNITNIQDNVFFIPPIPEPTTAALALLSIAGMGLRRRHRANR